MFSKKCEVPFSRQKVIPAKHVNSVMCVDSKTLSMQNNTNTNTRQPIPIIGAPTVYAIVIGGTNDDDDDFSQVSRCSIPW